MPGRKARAFIGRMPRVATPRSASSEVIRSPVETGPDASQRTTLMTELRIGQVRRGPR